MSSETHGSPIDPEGRDRDPFRSMGTGTMGMTLFVISLAVLFVATMAGYILIMIKFGGEQTVQENYDERIVGAVTLPPLPSILWASTAVILLSSVTLQWAKSGISKGSEKALKAGLVLTLILGGAFLVMQTLAWFDWQDRVADLADDKQVRFAMTSFYVLSGVHAAHLVGGVIPLLIVIARAFAGKYSARQYTGVANLTLYWHFLDVIWLLMFAMLLGVGMWLG